jgi:uncharacterized protein (TIGR02646 family)
VIHLQRGPAPEFWTREQVKAWTQSWLDKDCESARWRWPQHQSKALNQHACAAMELWHHNKCAFCEAPLWGGHQIEHFRSKTQYPLAAFVWRNLFLICPSCNLAKGSQNHEGCLKPDREDPMDYLWVNPISLKVEPKPGISEKRRWHARKTIERYGLDRPELAKAYREYLRIISWNAPEALADLLQELAQPEQPFSLMAKHLLEYHTAIT